MNVNSCRIIELPKITDSRGNLTFVEGDIIPFDIGRVYYLYDIPAGSERGGHAHKALHQFLVASSGAFKVHVEDGKNRKTFSLDRPYFGLYIPPMLWRTLDDFVTGSVALAIVSARYDEDDYFRDYSEYCRYVSTQ